MMIEARIIDSSEFVYVDSVASLMPATVMCHGTVMLEQIVANEGRKRTQTSIGEDDPLRALFRSSHYILYMVHSITPHSSYFLLVVCSFCTSVFS